MLLIELIKYFTDAAFFDILFLFFTSGALRWRRFVFYQRPSIIKTTRYFSDFNFNSYAKFRIRAVQELSVQKDGSTTMVYTHVS